MNSYFDQFKRQGGDLVRLHRHDPWYRRVRHLRHSRSLAVVFAALVLATPAVGAVSNWFGLGAPDRLPKQSATEFSGTAVSGTSQLTALRVADPQGGPPWSLGIVRTTRGDTCIQLGRVEEGRLGSLGIDGAWNDDKLFHPFPNRTVGTECGETDARGHGFINVTYTGQVANSDPSGPGAVSIKSCAPPTLPTSSGERSSPGTCPPRSARFVFMGLLGPDAASITYQTPDGKLATENTSGPQGAYLLIFTMTQHTCNLYLHGQNGSYGPCGSSEQSADSSPSNIGAIKAVTYKSGKVCRLTIPEKDITAQRELGKRIEARKLSGAQARRLFAALYKREHRTPRQAISPSCPPVGYVAPTVRRVTTAEVRAPVRVTVVRGSRWCTLKGPDKANTFDWIACDGAVPRGYLRIDMTAHHSSTPGLLIDISTSARVAVTSSRSFYDLTITNPPADANAQGCGSGSGTSLGFGDIRVGQALRSQIWEPIGKCPGIYRGVISYVQSSNPNEPGPGAGSGPTGQTGAAIVGRFSFNVP